MSLLLILENPLVLIDKGLLSWVKFAAPFGTWIEQLFHFSFSEAPSFRHEEVHEEEGNEREA